MAPRAKRKRAVTPPTSAKVSSSNKRKRSTNDASKTTRKAKSKKSVVATSEPDSPLVETSSQASSGTSPAESTVSVRSLRKSYVPRKAEVSGNVPTYRFNLSMEMWPEYSLAVIQDRGCREEAWTSSRLRTHVLYIETRDKRFELSRLPQCGGANESTAKNDRAVLVANYRLCEVKSPCALDDDAMRRNTIPLPIELKVIVRDELDWREIQWGNQFVKIGNITVEPTCMLFAPIQDAPTNPILTTSKQLGRVKRFGVLPTATKA